MKWRIKWRTNRSLEAGLWPVVPRSGTKGKGERPETANDNEGNARYARKSP